MKKQFLVLLLLGYASIAQTIAPTKVKITANTVSPSAPYVNVQEVDGYVNKINKTDLVDVLEFSSASTLPFTGVLGKIYVTIDNHKLYSWNGTFYNELAVTDISGKVDKVTGKSLLSDAEIARLATLANYTHPTNHPPSIISQDANNQFVTAAEKAAWNAKQSALEFTPENLANKNTANGYAGLDNDGKVPLTQINDVLLGSVNYKGTYNASAGTPALPTATSSNKGNYYKVSTAGTQFGLTFKGGDWIISDGIIWDKVDNNNAVASVNNQTGVVSLTTSNIPEGSNLYYTDARVSANSSVVANTAKVTNQTHAGDATGSTTLTLATVNSNVGTFGNASNVAQSTVNAKGLTTEIANVPIQIAENQVTGLVTDLAGKYSTSNPAGYISSFTETDPTVPAYSKSLSAFSVIKTSTDALYEPIFSKNTAFNKNFGTTAGTVAEGNDLRINNGQAAFGWGNHAGLYLPLTGNAANSTLWNGRELVWSNANVDSYLLGNASDGKIHPISPANVQSFLGLGSNAYTSTTYQPVDGFLYSYKGSATNGINADDLGANGVYLNTTGNGTGNSNFTTGYSVLSVIGNNLSYGQAQHDYDSSGGQRVRVRFGGPFSSWRKVWDDSNFNPASYLPLTGGTLYLNSTYSAELKFQNNTNQMGIDYQSNGDMRFINRTSTSVPATLNIITGNFNTVGTLSASGFFNSSDRRLKNIIKRDGEVVYFKWKDKRDTKTHIGYIAQEVKKQYPDQVQKGEGGMLSVNYIEVLVTKIQGLEKLSIANEKKINELHKTTRNKMKALELKLNQSNKRSQLLDKKLKAIYKTR